jgi:hypothetical protein
MMGLEPTTFCMASAGWGVRTGAPRCCLGGHSALLGRPLPKLPPTRRENVGCRVRTVHVDEVVGLDRRLRELAGRVVGDVSVNKKTGKITVDHLLAAQMNGLTISPWLVENQVSGNLIQGLSRGLSSRSRSARPSRAHPSPATGEGQGKHPRPGDGPLERLGPAQRAGPLPGPLSFDRIAVLPRRRRRSRLRRQPALPAPGPESSATAGSGRRSRRRTRSRPLRRAPGLPPRRRRS